MYQHAWFRKSVVLSVLVSLFASFLPMAQVAEALTVIKTPNSGEAVELSAESVNPGGGLSTLRSVGNVDTRYGLVAILVDEDTWDSQAASEGRFSFLGNTKLKEHIQTYAEDVQAAVPWTKSLIVTVSESDTPVEIQRLLERLYFEGNPGDSEATQLSGVVVVGDVPLPVVNKNGHRFVSMLPYTDFETPAYVLDESTQDFLPNDEGAQFQPEAWHGLIVPPLSGQKGINQLADFFEKNHAYHEGEEEYTDFEQRVFVGDLVTEEATLNPVSFGSYERWTDLWEETTYYQYTNDLVEELYTEMATDIEEGDGLDNDGDGNYDEEALNGEDDDGDGLIDEDLGDSFYNIDNDGDGLIDEDNTSDNNNDEGWVIDLFLEGDADLFKDRMVDEDPPGDQNGDGCPGVCGVDDNGDAEDHDQDGYPTGWEIIFGYDPFDERTPFNRVSDHIDGLYDQSFSDDDEATAFLQSLFIDDMYGDYYEHPSCFVDGEYHPEYDDDEDGFCDEDGSDEDRLWADEDGTPYSGSCAYNDADCDGEIDEDPAGLQPESRFADLPDIQSRNLVDQLTSRYTDLFEEPQGVWNRVVNQTGRYDTQSTDTDGELYNDYDTAISLIAKRDELVLKYLAEDVNGYFEARVDEIVEELQSDIPLVGLLQMEGEIIVGEDVEAICDPDASPDLEGDACLQFVNHSTQSEGKKFSNYNSSNELEKLHIYGNQLWEVEDVGECTLFSGNHEEGQLVQFNSLYSSKAYELSKSEVRDVNNCVPEFASYLEDIPTLCNEPTVNEPIRDLAGTTVPDAEQYDLSEWEVGFEACFEFRELTTYEIYYDADQEFNDWLTKKIRRFRKSEDSEDEESYAEFIEAAEEKRLSYDPAPGTTTLRKEFKELDLLAADEDRRYTVRNLFQDKGWEDFSDDDMDTFIGTRDDDTAVVVYNPQFGVGMEDVDKVKVWFNKLYLGEGSGAVYHHFSEDISDAATLPSMYKHVMPNAEVLNAQIEAQSSQALPVDERRYVSFLDAANRVQELDYLNVFQADDLEDFEAQLETLVETLSEVRNGHLYTEEVAELFSERNVDQMEAAIAWMNMNIDEKHAYVFTHYLGAEEPIFAKTRDGYEMAALVVDGVADEIFYGMNARRELPEGDLEHQYRSAAAIEAALAAASEASENEYEAVNEEVSNTTPVVITSWMEEVQTWLEEFKESTSSFGLIEGEVACGDASHLGGELGSTSDNSQTVRIEISSEDDNVLRAGGGSYYRVTARAVKANGRVNTSDSDTNVELEVISGADSVSVGDPVIQLTGGIAVFYVESGEEGNFSLQASSELGRSNRLSGRVEPRYVHVLTYLTETVEETVTVVQSEVIELKDEAGTVVATFDPTTGDLSLSGAVARVEPAEGSTPTRVVVSSADGEAEYGALFWIPELQRVSIGDGLSGVFVDEGRGSARSEDEGVVLLSGEEVIGLVTEYGQIGLMENYSLRFENEAAPNLYEALEVIDSSGRLMFTVTVKSEVDEVEFQRAVGKYRDYLSWMWDGLWNRLPQALAEAVSIPDTDGDLLDDLEEWTIGTELELDDSDGDGFLDGMEIFTGNDPLDATLGAPLFSDIGSDHEAYHDLAVLYLRGVISGFGDGTFRPDRVMTREEFVKVNFGAVCVNCDRFEEDYEAALLDEYFEDPFPDADINDELLACVAHAKVEDVVSGYAAGDFAGYFLPKDKISVAEATKVLVETAGLDVETPAEGEPWYMGYIRAANEYDLFPEGQSVTLEWLQGDITRAEFVMMAGRLIDAQDCRGVDSDGDGLSDSEETLMYGTDPEEVDSDAGGVNDLEEILRGSDPTNASDDFDSDEEIAEAVADAEAAEAAEITLPGALSDLARLTYDAGLYVVSNAADYGEVAVSSGEAGEVQVFTDEIAADGSSVLTVRAEIRDGDDQLDASDDSSVVVFQLSTEEHGAISTRRVQVDGGVAETRFKTSKISGEVQVSAELTDGSLPSEAGDIWVYPGEPAWVTLSGDSTVLPVGGEAVSDMQLDLFDSFGNKANNGFYTVTFDTDGEIELLDLRDEDASLDGIQVTTNEGSISFRVLASTMEEVAVVRASLPEVMGSGDRFRIEHLEGMELRAKTSQSFMLAGSSGTQTVNVRVVDALGRTVNGFQGDVQLSLSDERYGSFSSETLSLTAGAGSVSLSAGTLAGMGSIIVQSAGLESGSNVLEVKPAAAYELRLRTDDGATVVGAGETANFVIEAFDVYGNKVTTDGSTTGTIRLTDLTEEYGTLSRTNFTLNQGQARFQVEADTGSGALNLVASSGDLLAGVWSGTVEYSLSGNDFARVAPQMLYGSLLGGPFGDVTTEDYIAGHLTFNGRTQAMTSLISEPVPRRRLATVDAQGAITLPDDSLVTQQVLSAGSELPTRIQWRNYPDGTLLGEIFMVVPEREGAIATELLTARSGFELDEQSDGSVLLRKDSAAVVKVRADGQVSLLDSNYLLSVNAETDGLGYLISTGSTQVMRVDYSLVGNRDVTVLDPDFNLENWDVRATGLYVKPSDATEHQFTAIPTGNSSNNPQGVALIDPDHELDPSMQPNLGYVSLEGAEDNGNIGWEEENKHLLLFSAGNSVGQSNLYYPSEVGVVLGDPTVRLTTANESNRLGYTSDIGTLVSAASDSVLALLEVDYNDDDQPDVLLAYEDGRVELLQNTKSPTRLQRRGELLFVENGIESIDAGDFNGDGLDDLLIVTEEACLAEEMCLYIYENIGGGFVAKNLTLEGVASKPTQVRVADLNNDDYDELVLVDENMVLYAVWNAEGTLETVDEIKDFGLRVDADENLYGDVVVHYDTLASSSVNLSVTTTELSSSAELDVDLEDFLNDLNLSSGVALAIDGVSEGETVTKRSNVSFDYADVDEVSNDLLVTKRIQDDNGGRVEIGDTLSYRITARNRSNSDFESLYLSDLVLPSFSFDEESFLCSGCPEDVELHRGSSDRPWILGPMAFADGDTLVISYEVTVEDLPSLEVMVGQDFYSDYPDDNYADIGVSIEGNTTGTLLVYYSDGFITERSGEGFLGFGGSSFRRMNYVEQEYSEDAYTEEYAEETLEGPFEDADGDGIPDFIAEMDGEKGTPVPTGGTDVFAEVFGAVDQDGDGYYSSEEMFDNDDDLDGDGLSDVIDHWVSTDSLSLDPSFDLDALSGAVDGRTVQLSTDSAVEFELAVDAMSENVDGITQAVEDVVSMFTCNGGCVALPGSIAFLTPGMFHEPTTGTPLFFDPGWPLFGLMTYPTFGCTGPLCYGSNVMRTYLSPTTTLGLGLGLCFGPYGGAGAPNCWAFSLPVGQALGICDAINGFIADSLSQASSFAASGSSMVFNVDVSANSGESNGLTSSSFDGYTPETLVNNNIQVPGFPDIFTEWFKAQKQEFAKMLDLPDVTFIYPDPTTIATPADLDIDQESQLEAMVNGSLFGLERWLNVANSWPLVDIETQRIDLNYPAVSPEEIELIGRDWEDWVSDARYELSQYEQDYEGIKNDLTSAQREVVSEAMDAVEAAIAAMEANLAVLEGYRDIPEEILKIRELEAYYAKIIICYVDAILSYTAGYLSDQQQRVEAWAQWALDMTSIVEGWQALLDASVDFMDSCDKCTNQRWSSFHMLMSLFAFVPDFPVIEFPKLPDIVLDVSHIQSGVNLTYPDINFVPEPLNISKLPRINLPELTVNLDTDFEVELELPTLPTFDLTVELPELPGLPLPDLPSLPPPPSVPEIYPAVEAAVDIASNVMNVICVIRQGFVPVPEYMLKTKVEEITERPGGVVMPFDLAATVESASISFDFWERIEINTYLNLTLEGEGQLIDAIEARAEHWNEESGNFGERLEEGLQDFANDLEEVLSAPGNYQLEFESEVEGEASLTSYAHPGVETALQYKDHPMVSGQVAALGQMMEELQSQIDAWAETVPESYELIAEQRVLDADDPLLHRYDEVVASGELDVDFLATIQGTPLADLAEVRHSLMAYVDQYETGTQQLRGLTDERFHSYLAMEKSQPEYVLASEAFEADTEVNFEDEALWSGPNPLADLAIELASEDLGAAGNLSGLATGTQAQSTPQGLYLYDEEENLAMPLTAYTQEAEEASDILFVDLDDDGDEDIIYSVGGDVYVKENSTKTARVSHVSQDPREGTVAALAPDHGSLHNFKRGRNDYEEASYSFRASAEATGYESVFYDSMDAAEADPDENLKRLLLLEAVQNERYSFVDETGEEYRAGGTVASGDSALRLEANAEVTMRLDKNASVSLPEVRASRLVVTERSGRATLYNGYQRTKIASDREITSEDEVILQTTEDTRLEVTVNGTTAIYELPAYTWINLGRAADRRVRIERGEVIWIQDERVEEGQDLIDGMEIFAEETLQLDGRRGVTLQTSEGAEFTLDKEEVFVMDTLSNPSSPTAKVALENGAYYTVSRGLYADGQWGTRSHTVLLNPQVCADDAEPYPVVSTDLADDLDGDGTLDLALFTTTELSAENSFDSDSEIIDAFWDLDASVDVDGDGVANNDEEVIGLRAEIGPYDTLEPKDVTLWLTDAAGNQSTSVTDVNVYVPEIRIESATSESVSGRIAVELDDYPFSLVREREGAYTELGDFETEFDGSFTLEDFESSDLVSVSNDKGHEVASFDPSSRTLTVTDSRYASTVLEAGDGWPERSVVYELRTGTILASFILVEPAGQEVIITTAEELNLSTHTSVSSGPRVRPERNSETEVTASNPFADIEESDALYDSILELVELGILEGYVTDAGTFFNPDVALSRAEFSKIILSILCIVPSSEAYELPAVFNDIEDPELWYYPYTKEAQLRDLITGYLGEVDASGLAPFKPNDTITNAEAAKIILEALELQGIIDLEAELEASGVASEPWYAPYLAVAQALDTPILTAEEAADPGHTLTRYEFVDIASRVLEFYNCFEEQGIESIEELSESPSVRTLGLDPGIYAVREACNSCPCVSNIEYPADLRSGDRVFTIIQNAAGTVFERSNEMEIP